MENLGQSKSAIGDFMKKKKNEQVRIHSLHQFVVVKFSVCKSPPSIQV